MQVLMRQVVLQMQHVPILVISSILLPDQELLISKLQELLEPVRSLVNLNIAPINRSLSIRILMNLKEVLMLELLLKLAVALVAVVLVMAVALVAAAVLAVAADLAAAVALEVGRMWMVEPTQRKVSAREPAALVMEAVQAKELARA